MLFVKTTKKHIFTKRCFPTCFYIFPKKGLRVTLVRHDGRTFNFFWRPKTTNKNHQKLMQNPAGHDHGSVLPATGVLQVQVMWIDGVF